ncbi:uncharacterized protein AMSG_04647 [Thecamonas trahens ATCC 50062]|uniref:CATSPERD/E C-terminal domain-containing protein n=1 Tax=Thecamonas trahens ATCC 50062 TaxID=461836 RepID=A0A0L0DC69_THETB|nr:hypothetical protein AMSG_04647 [Thecamonas trahens ATCC 50062]KNC48903.1 hypothetical protein AMSG_04647 [Thecamonas trahens ATCC 50062]|eukprot:XP_013758321.1 hypothetical protein AMSG_04647 [Thecamonas trahens ATCC 50062]
MGEAAAVTLPSGEDLVIDTPLRPAVLAAHIPFSLSVASGAAINVTVARQGCALAHSPAASEMVATNVSVVCRDDAPLGAVVVDGAPLALPISPLPSACFVWSPVGSARAALSSVLGTTDASGAVELTVNISLAQLPRSAVFDAGTAAVAEALSPAAVVGVGETPRLALLESRRTNRVVLALANGGEAEFDASAQVWRAAVSASWEPGAAPRGLNEPTRVVLGLYSLGVRLMGCSVADAVLELSVGQLSPAALVAAGAATDITGAALTWPTRTDGTFRTMPHPSDPRHLLLLPTSVSGSSVDSVLYSHDGLETTALLQLGCTGCAALRDLVWTSGEALAVALTDTGGAVLLDARRGSEMMRWQASSGLPAGVTDALAAPASYDSAMGPLVVAYSHSGVANPVDAAVYLSVDSGRTFVHIGLNISAAQLAPDLTSVRIVDLIVAPNCATLLAMVAITTPSSSPASFTVISLRMQTVLTFEPAWSRESVLPVLAEPVRMYAPGDGYGVATVSPGGLYVLLGCGSSFVPLSGSGSSQVGAAASGAYVAVMSSGALLMGLSSSTQTAALGAWPLAVPAGGALTRGIYVNSWRSPLVETSFGALGAPRMTVFDVASAAPYVGKKVLAVEAMARTYATSSPPEPLPPATCSVPALSQNDVAGIEYVDAGRSLVVKSVGEPSFSVLRADLLQVRQQAAATFKVTEAPSAAAEGKGVVGRADQGTVVVTASDATPTACSASQMSSIVRVGCPPNRHIRIRGLPTSCSASMTYRVDSKSTVDGRSLVLAYDFEKLGCPFELYYGTDAFRPVLELYDGDEFVESVPGEFIIREVNGRKDWGYAAKVSDAGCNAPPRTWSQARAQFPERAPSEAWLPQDHVKCFDPARAGGPGSVSSSEPYQIFDSSFNGIRFTGELGGMFVFEVRVVEPAYSYCNLTAQFGADVFGEPLPSWAPLTIVFSIVGLSLVILIASYFFYSAHLKRTVGAKVGTHQAGPASPSGPRGRIHPMPAKKTQ